MKKNILLIEDDELIRDLYKSVLIDKGYSVDAEATGELGFKALRENQYDLLLLDLMLPDTNGLDILKKIKLEHLADSMKVVILTNLGTEPIIKQAFSLGADDYLTKVSLDPDQMVEKIAHFLPK